MNRSESISALAAALAKAQGQMSNAVKDTKNDFFKSKYADLSAVVDSIRRPLSDNGLSYVQVIHERDNGVGVETILMHSSGEFMSNGVMFAPATKHDAQGHGSALTYARRYSLQAALGVAAEDDDGNAAAKTAPIPVKAVKAKPQTKLSEQEVSMLVDTINATESLEQVSAVWEEAKGVIKDDSQAMTVVKQAYATQYKALRGQPTLADMHKGAA